MISTPLIWIVAPVVVSLVLMAFSNRHKTTLWIACIASLIFSIGAFTFPQDLVLHLFGQRFEIASILLIFNRVIKIEGSNLTLVGLLFSINLIWNLLSRRFEISHWFSALSFLITPLWILALSVEPFLYAAVIVEVISLVTVPILTPKSRVAQDGLRRYLILQTLAMTLVLLSGWMLTGISTAPADDPLVLRAAMMVFFGFLLWLAIFPLHSWVSMLAVESHPWVVSFMLSLRQSALIVYLLYFFDRYAWLRSLPGLFENLQWVGVLLIAIGGLLSAIQTNLRRQVTYTYTMETGFSLLAIGLSSRGGLSYLVMLFIPRLIAYWLRSFALAEFMHLNNQEKVDMETTRGLIHRFPAIAVAYLVSLLSLMGMPLFASFPAQRMLLNLIPTPSIWMLLLTFLGFLGNALYFFRVLRNFIHHEEKPALTEPVQETISTYFFVAIGILAIMFIGILPHLILPYFLKLLAPFEQLLLLP